jgi:hypothetical protein
MSEEVIIYRGISPSESAHDEVTGHVSVTQAVVKLRCWQCCEAFPINGSLRHDVFYVCCHCHSLNQPDLLNPVRSQVDGARDRPPGHYRAPLVLDSVFLRGPGGGLFEMSREEAERVRVGPDRFAGMDHPPYVLEREEVTGHHKTAGEFAVDPGAWSYHSSWEHGCYFDQASGEFCVGFHRHPYGDERAVGALESDFV